MSQDIAPRDLRADGCCEEVNIYNPDKIQNVDCVTNFDQKQKKNEYKLNRRIIHAK